MERIISYDNLKSFAYSNDKLINGKIAGVVVGFFGLGCMAMYKEDTREGKFFAQNNVIFVIPYANPWGWMNDDEVRLTDEILDVLFEKYGLDDSIPIVSTGGSMGGLASIIYTKYAKRTPCGCVANCPVCDLVYHFTEREDLPRTLYSAFYNCEGTIEAALRAHSPLHLTDTLPQKTGYTVFHCDTDSLVNIHMHSEKFVEKMRKTRQIEYFVVNGRDHCDLGDEMYQKYLDTSVEYIRCELEKS